MMQIWLDVLPEQRKYAVNQVVQRAGISNVMLNFRKQAKMNTTNLKHMKGYSADIITVMRDCKS
jgi:DNA-binding Xre family transcriptional regulator